MTTGDRPDPYLAFRYHVELDGLIVAGFSDVGGLEVELETETYEEGGVNRFTHTLPVRYTNPNITLERGITDSNTLWEWMNEGLHSSIDRKTGRIILLDNNGVEIRGWEFREGYPVRWEGPALSADRGSVAVETLEIAHNGLRTFEV